MKVFSPFLNGDTTTSGSLNLPQHPTASAIINPDTGSIYHDTTDNVVKVYTGTQWQVLGEQAVTVPVVASADIEYLLVAGGGGGGEGGGGAGGFLSSSLSTVTSGSSFTVTVGSGGSGGASSSSGGAPGTDGVDSSIAGTSISTITATKGGLGGGYNGANIDGSDGGSGGGGRRDGASSGGTGTAGQGNDGGTTTSGPWRGAGGGGGKSTAGGAGSGNGTSSGEVGGQGGAGLASKITGTTVSYSGGGGGGYEGTGGGGTGGTGGGGNGGGQLSGTSATSGTTNTGGGGGGTSKNSSSGGAGGSGVAIFAYDSGSINCAGGIVGDAGNGRKYHQFNASSILKVGNTTTDFKIVSSNLYFNLDAGDFASRGASTWTDLSGNSRNGTVAGNPTLGSNFYYTLDGSGDYFNLGSQNLQQDFTLEIWVKNSSWASTEAFFGQGTTSSNNGLHIVYVPGGRGIVFGMYSNDNDYNSVSLSTNVWHHLVFTYSHSTYTKQFYLDTVLKTPTSTGTNAYGGSGNLIIGGAYSSAVDTMSGDIAQVRMYNKILTAAEITQNYEATKTNFV